MNEVVAIIVSQDGVKLPAGDTISALADHFLKDGKVVRPMSDGIAVTRPGVPGQIIRFRRVTITNGQ